MATSNKNTIFVITVPHKTIAVFLTGKSQHTVELFEHFIAEFNTIGLIEVSAAKTMMGISNSPPGYPLSCKVDYG